MDKPSRECRRERVHSAADAVHALRLDVRDEIQRRGSLERRAAAVCRVPPEKLPEAWIDEERLERRRHRSKGVDACERRHPREPAVREDTPPGGALRAEERRLDASVDVAGGAAKADEPAGLALPERGADRRFAPVRVGEEIELGTVGPRMPREDVERDEVKVILRFGPRRLEELVENPPHRQHRRAAVHGHAPDVHGAHLAADRVVRFDEGHVRATRREVEPRGEPADACTEDDDALATHNQRSYTFLEGSSTRVPLLRRVRARQRAREAGVAKQLLQVIYDTNAIRAGTCWHMDRRRGYVCIMPVMTTSFPPRGAACDAFHAPSPADTEADAVERTIDEVIDDACGRGAPPRLAAALRYAVFPGGGRLRSRLCMVAATATRESPSALALRAAAAIELVHCASLVHDDLPCFDDAETRRGKPSVHRAFDEATATLVGDALIVIAFEALARGARMAPGGPLAELVVRLARGTGPGRGIIAGQAWEAEPDVALAEYHRAKTGSLFEVAAAMGALVSDGDVAAWAAFGQRMGCAYQAMDDLLDACGDGRAAGKPVGRDVAKNRPSLVRSAGVHEARRRVRSLLAEAVAALPAGRSRKGGAAFVAFATARAGFA